MEREQWLQRYRARIRQRRPDMLEAELAAVSGQNVHAALSTIYPNDPELAVDTDLNLIRAGY